MKRNKRKIYFKLVIALLVLTFLAYLVFLLAAKQINFSDQAYVARNISLVFTDQNVSAQEPKLDFLIADLKNISKTVSNSVVVQVNPFDQSKLINLLLSQANNIYIDIFTNKIANNLSQATFTNKFNITLPFEVRSYLTKDNDLKIIYNRETRLVKLILAGQNFQINDSILKLNDLTVFQIDNIDRDSIIQIGDLFIDLSSYKNNLATSIANLLNGNVKNYKVDSLNLLAKNNFSFETGAWTSQVADCSAYLGGQPAINMSLENDATNGKKSLALTAQNHFACSYFTFPVNLNKNKIYKLSFDYKTLKGNKIQYYYNLKNTVNLVQEKFGSIKTLDSSWHNLVTFIKPEIDLANRFSLYFYAPSDGSETLTDLYDNVALDSYGLVKEIPVSGLNFPKNYGLANWLVLAPGQNSLSYLSLSTNLLNNFNYSFEQGFWTKQVQDCSNYLPGQASIGMSLKNNGTNGKKSLALASQNHFACSYFTFPVSLQRDKLYVLSFDYKTVAGNKIQYYYNLQNDLWQQQEKFESVESSNDSWNKFETIINPQIENSNSFSLYFYAPSDGSKTLINQYDNVRLQEFAPKEIYSYYLYAQQNLAKPFSLKSIETIQLNRWQSRIKLTAAKGSLLLVWPPAYNLSAKLYLVQNQQANWLNQLANLTKQSINDNLHFQVQTDSNGWLLNIDSLCQNSKVCQKNLDGTYDVSLLVQNDFYKFSYLFFWLTLTILVLAAIYFNL
ncbi:MAG: hypothetical protein WC508_00560 [Patescibacteria group bacterium]